MTDEKRDQHEEEPKLPTKRELQQPIGQYGDGEHSWLSAETDDPLREEAAERAEEAVRPGRPRE